MPTQRLCALTHTHTRPQGTADSGGCAVYDAAVVGGGVVGLSVLRELAVLGYRVALIEKEEHLVAGAASSGNSGIGCTGYDAPETSLERALLRRAIQRHPALMRSLGLGLQHVNKCGALVVATEKQELEGLHQVVQANRAARDWEAVEISRKDLLEKEPALTPHAEGAVFVPREVVVEPWLIPIAYAHSAQLHGAHIYTGQDIVSAQRDTPPALPEGGRGVWSLESASGRSFQAKCVINCAGLYGDVVERVCLKRAAPYEIRPRRGQFLVFEPLLETPVGTPVETPLRTPSHVLQPVPTQYSKGVFVWTTLWGTVVVGPTAQVMGIQ